MLLLFFKDCAWILKKIISNKVVFASILCYNVLFGSILLEASGSGNKLLKKENEQSIYNYGYVISPYNSVLGSIAEKTLKIQPKTQSSKVVGLYIYKTVFNEKESQEAYGALTGTKLGREKDDTIMDAYLAGVELEEKDTLLDFESRVSKHSKKTLLHNELIEALKEIFKLQDTDNEELEKIKSKKFNGSFALFRTPNYMFLKNKEEKKAAREKGLYFPSRWFNNVKDSLSIGIGSNGLPVLRKYGEFSDSQRMLYTLTKEYLSGVALEEDIIVNGESSVFINHLVMINPDAEIGGVLIGPVSIVDLLRSKFVKWLKEGGGDEVEDWSRINKKKVREFLRNTIWRGKAQNKSHISKFITSGLMEEIRENDEMDEFSVAFANIYKRSVGGTRLDFLYKVMLYKKSALGIEEECNDSRVKKQLEKKEDSDIFWAQVNQRAKLYIFYILLVLIAHYIITTAVDGIINFINTYLSRGTYSYNSFVIETSYPTSKWEYFLEYFFGIKKEFEPIEEEVFLPEPLERQFEEYENNIMTAVENNMRLDPSIRANGGGMLHPNTLLSGAPGLGKSFKSRQLLILLHIKGYIDFVRINVAALRHSSPEAVVSFMIELREKARVNYERTGKLTIFEMNEMGVLVSDHTSDKTNEIIKAFVAILLTTFDKSYGNPIVYIGTTNITEEELSGMSKFDRAVFSRTANRFIFSKPGADVLLKGLSNKIAVVGKKNYPGIEISDELLDNDLDLLKARLGQELIDYIVEEYGDLRNIRAKAEGFLQAKMTERYLEYPLLSGSSELTIDDLVIYFESDRLNKLQSRALANDDNNQ